MLSLTGQFHLCDEQEYALFPLYECQTAFQDILRTLQNIPNAILDNLFFPQNPIPAASLQASQKTSTMQNLSCSFFPLYLLFFLPAILLCSISPVFHNHQALKCQNKCHPKSCKCNASSAKFLSY